MAVDPTDEPDRKRLAELVSLSKEQRSWVWEIHKNCDQLLHQRLASFTAAQAMTLASFTVLTVARFNADPCKIALDRIWLLDFSRFFVILFGIFLAVAGFLVTYPMLKRLKYLNDTFFPKQGGDIYRDYLDCIEWNGATWSRDSKTWFPYRWYREIIPRGLPLAEGLLWIVLLVLLLSGLFVGSQGCTADGQPI